MKIYEGRVSKVFFFKKKEMYESHRNPISHGTKRSPAQRTTQRNAERNGVPIAKATSHPFRRSVTNSIGVVLLNPCFSSSTNVLYRSTGSDGSEEAMKSTAEKIMLCGIFVRQKDM